MSRRFQVSDRAVRRPAGGGAACAAGPAGRRWPRRRCRSAGDRSQQGFDGVVEAVRQTVVAAQVAGAVVALDVKAGDTVKAGQVLVRIDARAAEQNASASDAQVRSAQALLDVASKDFERQKQLFDKQYISQAALERAESQFKATQAQAAGAAGAGRRRAHAVGLCTWCVRPMPAWWPRCRWRWATWPCPAAAADAVRARCAARHGRGAAKPASLAVPPRAEGRVSGPAGGAALARAAAQQVQLLPTVDAATHTVQLRIALPAGLTGRGARHVRPRVAAAAARRRTRRACMCRPRPWCAVPR